MSMNDLSITPTRIIIAVLVGVIWATLTIQYIHGIDLTIIERPVHNSEVFIYGTDN